MARKVFLNGRFLTQPLTGVQRVAIEFIKQLDNLLESDSDLNLKYNFILIHPKGKSHDLKLKRIKIKEVPFLKGNLWEQLVLPFYSFNSLLISMCMVSCLFKRKQIVFIHDASALVNKSFFTFSFRTWYRIAITVLGKVSLHIMTMSEHAKSELIKHAHISSNKISVIYLSAKHLLKIDTSAEREEEFIKKHALIRPYILAVSSLSPNKNFKSITAAFDLLKQQGYSELELVIAGGSNNKVFKSESSLEETVKYLGYVSDEELVYLYKNASVFVFPSFYEGFGIPPLEAMQSGCPVVVSNTSSIPEVCNDAAVYCNPYDVADIANKIKQVLLMSNDDRANLITKGKKHSSKFDWNNCTQKTIDIITSI